MLRRRGTSVGGGIERRPNRRTRRGLLALALSCLLALAALSGTAGVVGTASAANAVGGCTTIDQPGAYTLDADVTDSGQSTCIEITASDVVLDGQGHAIDGTNATDSVAIQVGSTPGALSNVTVRDVTVTDWEIGVNTTATGGLVEGSTFARMNDADSLLGGAITLVGAHDTVVGDNTFRQPLSTTATAVGYQAPHRSDGILIQGNHFAEYDPGDPVFLNGENIRVLNNEFEAAPGGVTIEEADGSAVALNTFTSDGTGLAIDVRDSNDVDVTENTVSTYGEGIFVDDSRNVRVADNDLTTVGLEGIELRNQNGPVEGVTVANNQLSDVGRVGLDAEGVNDSTFRNNDITNTGDSGVALTKVTNVTVRGSTLADNENGSVRVHDGSEVTVDDVTIRRSSDESVYVNGTAGTTITDTVVADSDGAGIETRSGSVEIADTTVRGSFFSGLIAGTDGMTTENVTLADNMVGARFQASGQVHTNLTVVSNKRAGIETTFGGTIEGAGSEIVDNGARDVYPGVEVRTPDAVVTLRDATVANNTGVPLQARLDGRIDAEDVTLRTTTGERRLVDANLLNTRLAVADGIPTPPGDVESIGHGTNVTVADGGSAGGPDTFANVTVHYADDDVDGVKEATLAMYRHDGSWSEVGGGLDAGANLVFANVSATGLLAPMAEPASAGGGGGGGSGGGSSGGGSGSAGGSGGSTATPTATPTPTDTPTATETPDADPATDDGTEDTATPTATQTEPASATATDEGGAPTPADDGGIGPVAIGVLLVAVVGVLGAGIWIARNE